MSSRAPWVTVIVPTFGRPAYLAEAVDSVLGQRERDLECIVIDDASPEPVHVPRDPRLLVVRRTDNGGPAAARNTGLDAARGEVVCFLDDDDLWLPQRLELAAAGLRRAPLAICWTSFVHQPDASGTGRVLEGDVGDTILDGLTPSLGATAVRRADALPFTAGMDNLEDLDWWWRMAQRCRVATEAEIGHRYRNHDGPRARTGLAARLVANEAFLTTHADWFATHPRAAAFRWRRVGLLARAVGDRQRARRAFGRSLRLHPSPRSAAHLARATARW
jgi:glycosyltransferase involved in cell wall biosynthesis